VDPDTLDPGLARDLSAAGVPVFAVTFAARYGDNLNQALALAAALQRVRQKTGADVVDVVAHSKGGLALLAYLTGMLDSRGVPYDGEVGQVLLLGVPVGGMDFSFRHPAFNYSSSVWGLELPSSWDQALLWGTWQDTWDDSIYGGAYDGLLQALARWDEVHALSMTEQDWYTTYEGGTGFVSHSLGIDAAIEQGGGFMAELRSRSLPAGLPVGVLVGTSPYVGVTAWELTGPSDCLVFTESAGDTDWLESAGATVVAADELAANHWELVHVEEAREWVRSLLR
jgi:triacylglycerol lipase